MAGVTLQKARVGTDPGVDSGFFPTRVFRKGINANLDIVLGTVSQEQERTAGITGASSRTVSEGTELDFVRDAVAKDFVHAANGKGHGRSLYRGEDSRGRSVCFVASGTNGRHDGPGGWNGGVKIESDGIDGDSVGEFECHDIIGRKDTASQGVVGVSTDAADKILVKDIVGKVGQVTDVDKGVDKGRARQKAMSRRDNHVAVVQRSSTASQETSEFIQHHQEGKVGKTLSVGFLTTDDATRFGLQLSSSSSLLS